MEEHAHGIVDPSVYHVFVAPAAPASSKDRLGSSNGPKHRVKEDDSHQAVTRHVWGEVR